MTDAPVLPTRPACLVQFPGRVPGTFGLVDADAVRALIGYVEQRDGIRDVLGCGCTPAVECGYHREQSARTASVWGR